MNRNMVMGIVRALLAGAGGSVAAGGFADEQTVNEIVGAILVIIAGVWSIAEKRRAMKAAPAAPAG